MVSSDGAVTHIVFALSVLFGATGSAWRHGGTAVRAGSEPKFPNGSAHYAAYRNLGTTTNFTRKFVPRWV